MWALTATEDMTTALASRQLSASSARQRRAYVIEQGLEKTVTAGVCMSRPNMATVGAHRFPVVVVAEHRGPKLCPLTRLSR